MISGVTGEEFAADIFIGPVYYQRLRHMVADKFQVGGDLLHAQQCASGVHHDNQCFLDCAIILVEEGHMPTVPSAPTWMNNHEEVESSFMSPLQQISRHAGLVG